MLEDISSSHTLVFNEAQKNESGRPFAGNCFFVRKTISQNVETLYQDHHILAIKLVTSNESFIFTGIYLPASNKSRDEYKIALSSIEGILKQHRHESEVIIFGDFQSFPEQLYDQLPRNNTCRNLFSPLLTQFLLQNELCLIDVTEGNGPSYTYNHAGLDHYSYIDHIAVSKYSCCIKQPQILLDEMNTSDHLAISFSVTINEYHAKPTDSPNDYTYHVPNYLWKNEKFVKLYQTEINKMTFPQFDPSIIESNISEINQSLIFSAKEAEKQIQNLKTFKHKKRKTWWNDDLSQHKIILSEKFKCWKDTGFDRSEQCIEYSRYKLAKKNLRYAIKQAQNNQLINHYVNLDGLKRTRSDRFGNSFAYQNQVPVVYSLLTTRTIRQI